MSKSEVAKIKRRQYFVQKNFQFKFILKFCIVLLIGIIISTGLLLLFSIEHIDVFFRTIKACHKEYSFCYYSQCFFEQLDYARANNPGNHNSHSLSIA